MAGRNMLLLACATLLAVIPLFMGFQGEGIFTGSDNQAEAVIQQVRPGYEPWFTPLWEPPSAEIESLLFSLQAALGAGLLGFYLGLRRGETKARERTHGDAHG